MRSANDLLDNFRHDSSSTSSSSNRNPPTELYACSPTSSDEFNALQAFRTAYCRTSTTLPPTFSSDQFMQPVPTQTSSKNSDTETPPQSNQTTNRHGIFQDSVSPPGGGWIEASPGEYSSPEDLELWHLDNDFTTLEVSPGFKGKGRAGSLASVADDLSASQANSPISHIPNGMVFTRF